MTEFVVETKLLVPRVRRGAVERPRLDDLLARGAGASLMLVSAPPGFGKTTLVATWLKRAREEGRATAWVSLDERDRSATSFWTYTLLALERAAPGSAAGALSMLQAGQASVESVLAAVLNELSVSSDDVMLVLDDYHLADGPEIRLGIVFLLEHLPPQLHLVICTRADPALPLARLRARGELVEIRAADLRFSDDETVTYLTGVAGLDLAATDVAALEGRTEGWIAALQLAALSLQGREDPAGFIAGFAGDDRYVLDYLAEEVLDRQPAGVRGFLLQTCILDRLTASLCDAVTGESNSKAMLESLERDNMFLVPLDEQRRWYRYHHLFADVLSAHLLDEHPEDVPELHRRASAWYAETGDPVSAVRHALAAGEVDRAADLVELAIPALGRERREPVIRRWMDELPTEVVRNRPVLALGFIGAMAGSNEFDGLEPRLRALEEMLARPADELVVVDDNELARVRGAIELYWSALALAAGDLAGTVAHAELAIARAADGDDLTVAAGSALAGLAAWTGGDLDAAHRGYTAAIAGLERADHLADVLGCTITLADLDMTQGRLNDAERAFRRALELAQHDDPGLRGTSDMFVGLSTVAWERNDLTVAAEHLRRADALGESAALAQNPYRWRVAMARIREAEGDSSTALELLDEAIRLYTGDYSPEVRPVHALRARVLARRGDVDTAMAWAREHNLSATDDLSYLHEYQHVTLARVLIAEHASTGSPDALQDALGLLDRLLRSAEDGGRIGTAIEILVLQAVAHQRAAAAGRDSLDALARLDRAVTLAEPDGWVRVFLGEGPTVMKLLEKLARRRPDSAHLRRILDASAADRGPGVHGAPAGPREPGAAAGAQQDSQRLVDPLSERELDVLRLLVSDLDGPSIARELVVSLNTVRTHTKHIYTKLGVNNRRSAVRQAHQLNLLARS